MTDVHQKPPTAGVNGERQARGQLATIDPFGQPQPRSEIDEKACLGGVLLAGESGEDWAALLGRLELRHFYDERHRAIYKTLKALAKSGITPTTLSIAARLNDKRTAEDCGGIPYVSGLFDGLAPFLFGEHFEKLEAKTRRRTIIDAATRLATMARDEAYDPQALANDARDALGGLIESTIERKEHFRFWTPTECQEYKPATELFLVGDFHITRGSTCVIAGPPGAGKSRAATSLAFAGAAGCGHWLGLPVRRHFRTVILQAENGRHRLKDEFTGLASADLDEWIRISEPPPFGVRFDDPGFRVALAGFLDGFKADVVVLDPWNSAVNDDKQRDYAETFRAIRETLPKGEHAPALVIVAHTRKPSGDSKRNGRSLMFDVAGSHMIASVPRSIFILQPASDDAADDRVVWTNSKNNDGPLCQRTAWHRRDGRFDPCQNFDWEIFDGAEGKKRSITEDDLCSLFEGGKRRLTRTIAVDELSERTGMKRTACYSATAPDGRFNTHLSEEGGLLSWQP